MRKRVIVITYNENYVSDWFKKYFDEVFEISSLPVNKLLNYL